MSRPYGPAPDRPDTLSRREFLASTGALALAAGASSAWDLARETSLTDAPAPAESIVRLFFDSLTAEQKRVICFDWEHTEPTRGLLRTHVANHWKVSPPSINSDFFTRDQRMMIRAIFEGITSPDWHARFDQQFRDDCGGFGEDQQIAIFGTPGTTQFECVLSGRHMTLRYDGDSADHVAFAGPIVYGHSAEGFFERPGHAGNIFWEQALEANRLYRLLDGRQRALALVRAGMPEEHLVGFRGVAAGTAGGPAGIPVGELSSDQTAEVQRVLTKLLEPFRQSDRDEVVRCLHAQGGLARCSVAFYEQADIGADGVWDNWRLEGPSFVWHFRGKPHVHVWVHVASSPTVALNSVNDSMME